MPRSVRDQATRGDAGREGVVRAITSAPARLPAARLAAVGPSDLPELQRQAGNRATTSLLRHAGQACPGCQGHPAGTGLAGAHRHGLHAVGADRPMPADGDRSAASAVPPVRRTLGPLAVQRHASYEHRVLGDIPPDHLFALGAHTNLAGDPDAADVTVQGLNGAEKVTRANVVHVLDQELRRLRAWQSTEPKTTSMDTIGQDMDDFKQAVEAKAKEGHETDSEWNVRIVAIDSTVGAPPLLVTYGELNTLADFYGSVNELRAADPAKRRNVVQSVRQQSYEQLLKIYEGVAGSGDQEALAENKKMPEFSGAFNITGTAGEVGQMAVDKKGGSGTTAYTATLARNACHFAPESWHSWEDHHHKALQLAIQSHGTEDGNEKRKLANQALLYNGFGDHYLQDSYASGHLINKTKIMQMYVRHLDEHPPVTSSYTSDWTWRAFQSMAYRQEGLTATSQYDKGAIGRRGVGGKEVTTARNPQAVENTQEMEDFSWQNRFEMLGLKVPSGATPGTGPWKLLVWMQKQRGGFLGNRYTVDFAYDEVQGAAKDIGLGTNEIGPALYRLVQDNIVYKTDDENGDESRQEAGERLEGGRVSSGGKFSLRKEWVVSITGPNEKNFDRATAKGADPGSVQQDGPGDRLQGVRGVHEGRLPPEGDQRRPRLLLRAGPAGLLRGGQRPVQDLRRRCHDECRELRRPEGVGHDGQHVPRRHRGGRRDRRRARGQEHEEDPRPAPGLRRAPARRGADLPGRLASQGWPASSSGSGTTSSRR